MEEYSEEMRWHSSYIFQGNHLQGLVSCCSDERAFIEVHVEVLTCIDDGYNSLSVLVYLVSASIRDFEVKAMGWS